MSAPTALRRPTGYEPIEKITESTGYEPVERQTNEPHGASTVSAPTALRRPIGYEPFERQTTDRLRALR